MERNGETAKYQYFKSIIHVLCVCVRCALDSAWDQKMDRGNNSIECTVFVFAIDIYVPYSIAMTHIYSC